MRRLHRAEGLGIKTIARRLGISRNTVRDALRSDEPPRYERAPTGSVVDAVEPQIRELLGEFPMMPAYRRLPDTHAGAGHRCRSAPRVQRSEFL